LISLIDGIRAARYMRRPTEQRTGDAAELSIHVFCPCKGADHEFEENIRSILHQDLRPAAVHFIVDSQDDPAYQRLKKAGVQNVLIAGPAHDCGQKVHNLQYAIERAGRPDVYVFCDSDARYPRYWLRRLTAPLGHGSVSVTSGYRWYVASKFNVPTLLRSAWNATVVSMLGDHARNFVWGGSTAIRRETFERIGVLDAWRGAVSDDYAITRAVQRAGLPIRFVPDCLIPSFGDCSFYELLEFTTRQIIITRVYHARLWWIGFVAQATFSVTFTALGIAMFSNRFFAIAWAALYALSAAKAAIRLNAVRAILPDPELTRFGWFHIVSSPVIAYLYLYNMVRSALTTDIEWRQIHYTLISPNETRVRRSSASAS
jgi:ceramide glucosyltransferase